MALAWKHISLLISSVTQTQGASATIPFSGNAVAVYGTVSPDHADIQVSLDGKNTTVRGGAGGLAGALHTQVCGHPVSLYSN